MLKGNRKLIMCIAFLGCSTYLVSAALSNSTSPDLVGLSTVIGAIAAGVFSLSWGNVQEHKLQQPKS